MPYDPAYIRTMVNEGLGVWTNDPIDPGGETFSGISRVHNPNCPIWPIIDLAKKTKSNFNAFIKTDPELLSMVKTFYFEYYWTIPGFGRVNTIFPRLAEKMFNAGVLYGIGRSSEWFQRTINLMNRNQKVYPDIKVDRSIGGVSINALVSCLKHNPEYRVFNTFKSYVSMYNIQKMESDPTKEKYIGWLDRAEEG